MKGAVKNPGVYQMKEGDRVHDALKKAGGTEKKADQKQINLAAVLRDGMVLYIPFEGEEAAGSLSEADSRADAAQVISSISIRLPLRSFRRFPGSVLQKRKR